VVCGRHLPKFGSVHPRGSTLNRFCRHLSPGATDEGERSSPACRRTGVRVASPEGVVQAFRRAESDLASVRFRLRNLESDLAGPGVRRISKCTVRVGQGVASLPGNGEERPQFGHPERSEGSRWPVAPTEILRCPPQIGCRGIKDLIERRMCRGGALGLAIR
jgi:hypothetical protein